MPLGETDVRFGSSTVVVQPDAEEPHRYNVRVPALPGCLTYGESMDDTVANAIEANQGCVASMVADGTPIPVETHPAIAATIAVPLIDIDDGGEELEMREPAGAVR